MSGLPSLKLLVNTTKLPKITILAVRLYLMAHFDFSFSPFCLPHRSSSGFFRILSPTRMLLSQCYPYFHLSYFLLLCQECTFFLGLSCFHLGSCLVLIWGTSLFLRVVLLLSPIYINLSAVWSYFRGIAL